MNTHQKHYSRTISYYEALAYSLIQFAEENKNFSDWLQNMFVSYQKSFSISTHNTQSLIIPTLKNEMQAIRRTQWLIELGGREENTRVAPAFEILTQWASIREKEDPKAIILGLVIGVEPFGLFGEVKKKHHPIDIVVRNTVLKKTKKTELAKMSIVLANEIVQKALIEVKGNANVLEPELSDWFFGDKTIVFYSADKKTLESVEQSIQEIQAPHAYRADDDGTTFLAIGPTLYVNDLAESNKLEEVT